MSYGIFNEGCLEVIQTMRECLKTGKPYELPADVQKLIEEGAMF